MEMSILFFLFLITSGKIEFKLKIFLIRELDNTTSSPNKQITAKTTCNNTTIVPN